MYTFDRVAIKNHAKELLPLNRSQYIAVIIVLTLVSVILGAISAGLLGVIVNCLLEVAVAGFFLAGWRGSPRTVNEMFVTLFDDTFLRKLGGMLWMMLKVFLWSLLFVIPGIIKALSYAMTPYILHQYPNVPAMEACNISEKMMKGHKTDLFITELSFLGWILLSGLTLGILYILYVGPYMEMTMAGIYDELQRLALESNIVTEAELNGEVQL